MNVVIRRANKNDYPAILKLEKEFAIFEKDPEKVKNTVELMINEK